MKRTLFITDYFRPEPGGLEALFTGIARHWPGGSLEVIVTARAEDHITPPAERETFDQGEPYRILRVEPPRPGLFQRDDGEFSRVLRERFRHFEPAHLICGQISTSARLAARLAREVGIPYSVFLNGGDYKNKLGLINFAFRRMLMGASNVFTVSRYLARELRALGVSDSRLAVIPPGMEPRWDDRKAGLPGELRERTREKFVLLGVGPFVPRKGLDIAVEALNHIGDLKNDVHLVLMGSGPEFNYLEELARIRGLGEHVTLTGFLNDADFGRVMRQADLLVQPGCEREDDVESVSTTIMEAAWFGVPSVAGKIGGVDEIIQDGISGILVAPGDALAFAAGLTRILRADPLRKQIGRNAREMAAREYDLSRTCAAIVNRL